VIAFQVQEHGIQHGEESIFSNGSILFLPHITWLHAKSFVQVNQRHTTNKTSEYLNTYVPIDETLIYNYDYLGIGVEEMIN
jgi:hypothetical protein